jgi:peptidoglycan-N-acetylglucosamine deacetylase
MTRRDVQLWIVAALALSCASIEAARGSYVATQNPDLESHARAVVITVDDLPGTVPGTGVSPGNLADFQRINRGLIRALVAHHVPAIGFVNEWKVQVSGERDARVTLLQSWLDAGLALGNHTYGHVRFQTTPLSEYEDETIRGEAVTRVLMNAAGKKETYFRHPFLSTGPTADAKAAFEKFLEERGYRVAPVTVNNDDYMFNDVLGDAIEKKDNQLAQKARIAYLDHMDAAFDYFEGASRSLFHREIPQVLLIHDSELNAECLDSVLTNLERRGYRFVPLDEALADPAYATPDRFIGPQGISWLSRWKVAFGQSPWNSDPDPPAWISKMSDEIRAEKQGK